MMKLSRKDFKATITKIFQKAIINILEIHKKKKKGEGAPTVAQ